MDFFDLIDKRRSVRKFSNESIPEGVITKALKSAVLAANSSNLQPWEFYWVKSRNKKEDLIKACFSQNAAKTAQELIVAVSRIDTWRRNRNLILKHYKDKTLEHHQMSLIADMLTLEDIKNVSKWYSSIKITIQDLEN